MIIILIRIILVCFLLVFKFITVNDFSPKMLHNNISYILKLSKYIIELS